jgi:hypothetical protein
MMKIKAGLCIDHHKAIIVDVTDKGDKTSMIISKAEKQSGRFKGKRIVSIETVDMMTDSQITAKVRKRFLKEQG